MFNTVPDWGSLKGRNWNALACMKQKYKTRMWNKEDNQYKNAFLSSLLLWVTDVWSQQYIMKSLIQYILELIKQMTKEWNLYPSVLIPCCSWAVPPVFTPSQHKVVHAWMNIISWGHLMKNQFLHLETAAKATAEVRVWDDRILKWCMWNVYCSSWHMADMLWTVNINIIMLLSIKNQTLK